MVPTEYLNRYMLEKHQSQINTTDLGLRQPGLTRLSHEDKKGLIESMVCGRIFINLITAEYSENWLGSHR